MRVVLLQVRDDEPAAAQERLCFLEAGGFEPQELRCINLVREPRLDFSSIGDAQALLVGGAGAHSVTREYEFSEDLNAVVRLTVEAGKPYFGSCFGHQVLVKALGGEVVTDNQAGEVGTFDVDLTQAGRTDPLLAGFPSRFAAQFGHHDRADTLPSGLIELAHSRRCRFQLLRVVGKPVYGSQFHCEMTDQHLRVRLEMYRDTYLAERTTRDEVSSSLRPSPWADGLLRRFIHLYT